MKAILGLVAVAVCGSNVCMASQDGMGFSLQANGGYTMTAGDWHFSGSLGGTPVDRKVAPGRDGLGSYTETSFKYGGNDLSVRTYPEIGVAVFSLSYPRGAVGHGIAFPDFTDLPQGLSNFSFRNQNFARPGFKLYETCTPWLCFDHSDRAFIFSPASSFMVSSLKGDGKNEMASTLNENLKEVPRAFVQSSMLVVGQGIGRDWAAWSRAMQALFHKQSQGNEADLLLQKFGYWTDNGADYYYNYEPDLGYAGTLVALRGRYQQEGIPLGYMQLDSWWYDKSTTDPDGKQGGSMKNPKLPQGLWNRYGGTMSYRADKDLFPDGLAAFHRQLGLPLAVHNRWIDRSSPYHDHYKISGIGAVDPKWWLDTASYLASSGVVCYEQDWLDNIYAYSPEMSDEVGPGDAFSKGMSQGCRTSGLDMQYCMATPRFFLQGLLFSNLTTIRTSDDRFDKGKWRDFLYVNQLAHAVGIWPWCDVFKSGETGNMLLSVLSAGPVGTGDRIGKENKDNILKAVRPDGVIVKPDVPILPIDQSYLDESAGLDSPFVASTYTEANGEKTVYVWAFPRAKNRTAIVPLVQTGVIKRAYCFNPDTGEGRFVEPADSLTETIGEQGYFVAELAPVLPNGMVVLGDLGKYVPTGKMRIQKMDATSAGVRLEIEFASGEDSVVLSGLSPRRPQLHGQSSTLLSYDEGTGRFEVSVRSLGLPSVSVKLS